MNAFTRAGMVFATVALALQGGTARPAAGQVTGTRTGSDPPVVAYRQSVMQELSAQLVALRPLLLGEVPRTGDLSRRTSAVLATASTLSELFPPNSGGRSSAASADIWSHPEDFRERLEAFRGAAQGMHAAVQTGDRAVAAAHYQVLVGTCGGCHAAFRRPARPVGTVIVN